MAEFDPNTITLGELLDTYVEDKKLKRKLTLGPILKEFKDTPALDFFAEEGEDISDAKKAIKAAAGKRSQSSIDNALKVLRYTSNHLYNAYDKNPPAFLLSNEKFNPKASKEFFGAVQGPKAVSTLEVNPDPEVRKSFVKQLMEYGAKNPDQKHVVRAIMFGLNTGLRPNAVVGLDAGSYIPDKGALYIRPEVTGAKGRAVSVPLNNVADSMLQQQLRDFKEPVGKSGKLFTDANGKVLATSDVNKVLEQIKVPNLVYDSASDKYYDSFKPKDATGSKFGMSLFRNYHTTTGLKLGIPDNVLAKLQGRSMKSYGKGSTGELYTYNSAFPGDVSDYERKQANMLTEAFSGDLDEGIDAARKIDPEYNFDYGTEKDIVQERITQRTEGFGDDYFKREVTAEAPEQPAAPEAEEKKKLTVEEKKGIFGKLLKGFGKGTAVLAPVAIGLGAAEKAQAAEKEIEEGAPVLPTVVGKTAEFLYEDVSPISMPGQMAEMLGDVQPATEEEALQDPEAFTESDVGMIRREQKKQELEDADKLQNFLEQDLIQP
jgi:integrase